MKTPPYPHYRRRFPAEIISQAVWLYHVFSLSLRDAVAEGIVTRQLGHKCSSALVRRQLLQDAVLGVGLWWHRLGGATGARG